MFKLIGNTIDKMMSSFDKCFDKLVDWVMKW